MTVRALVPLKRLSAAKSRLADVLAADERRRLALSMAVHVVAVVRRAVDEAILLTPEPVPELGDIPMILDAEDGLNANIAYGARLMDARLGDVLLVVFADLPLLEAGDVAALIAAAGQGIAIAPDRLGVGVNAVGFRQPLDLDFGFGPGSRRRFEAEAQRLGRPAILVERPGLALDIDDADSLSLYAQRLASDR
jgi:2-phospho-L-lactate guanylyltransferase